MGYKSIYRLRASLIVSLTVASVSLTAQALTFEDDAACGITEVADIAPLYGHGAAAVDYDQDGDIDFYLGTTAGIPDRLYQNDGTGHFVDVAASVGLGLTSSTSTALWFDYNNDKRLDLLTLGERCHGCEQPITISLFEQGPDGMFVDVASQAGLEFGTKYDNLVILAVGGISAGDINQDGYLDLVIAIWGGKVTVFMNNKDKTFSDISVSSGLGLKDKKYWQPMIHDFNGDNLVDIYCNVDFDKNQFWVNNGDQSFSEIAQSIGASNSFNEMGMALGDYDNDGDFDIYATNITGEKYVGRHNILLRNDSQGTELAFTEIAENFGVGDSGWDWGTTWADVNNDGWVDLAATNGFGSAPIDQSRLWLNVDGTFTDYSVTCQFNDELSASTIVAFDADRDGDLDILQTLKDPTVTKLPAKLYRNRIENQPSRGNYITVKPRMGSDNHFAVGTVVKIKAGTLNMMRLISAGTSFYGQEPYEAFFGLDQNETIEEVNIEWPDGGVSTIKNVGVNQVVTVNYDRVIPPDGLTGKRVHDGVQLSWEDNSNNELGFMLQRSSSADFATYSTVIVAANSTSFTDIISDPGQLFYRIRAFNQIVTSPYSNPLMIDIVTGVENPEMGVSFYPNPFSNVLGIELDDPFIGIMKFRMLDLQGRSVFQTNIAKDAVKLRKLVRPELVPGFYIIYLQLGRRSIKTKVWMSQ